jgi:hypothetical protein
VALQTFLRFNKGAFGGVFGLQGLANIDLPWRKVNIELKKKTPIVLYHAG